MQEIQRVLKAASWRLLVVDFFRTSVVTITVTLCVLFLLRVGEKLFPIAFDWTKLALIAAGSAVVMAMVWAWIRRARGLKLAREVDERAGLRESISTALIVEGRDDGWSRLVVETARERARRVVVRDAVPIEAPKMWQAPLVLGLALLCVWWVPRYDVTGLMARKEAEERQDHEVQQVMAEIKVDEKKLDDLLKKAGIDEGEKNDIQPPEMNQAEPKSLDDIRRDQLRMLTDKAEQIKAKQDGEQSKMLDAMKNQLRQLKTPGDGPATEFARDLARGNFQEAKEALEELAEQLQSGKMSDEDKQKAKEQIENLKQQLEQLAQNTEQLEQALQQAGLSEEQAQQLAQAALDPQKMQQALQQMEGLSQEQKQQLQEMAEAQSKACQSCNSMAGAMGQMSQGMGKSGSEGQQQQAEGMNGMSGQLSQMEMAQQEMQNLQAAAAECQGQINKLSQSMCDGNSPGQCFGEGSQGQFKEGSSMNQGNGQGGPGKGSGGGMDEEQTDFITERIKENVANQGGPIIGETVTYGEQVRGESTAQFHAAVTSAKMEAAAALEQKSIPKKYQGAVQNYFGNLEKVTDSDKSSAPASEGSDAGKKD